MKSKIVFHFVLEAIKERNTTVSGGSLGSLIEEERSQLR